MTALLADIIIKILVITECLSNTILLLVTILSNNLRTTCNLLIALEALCIVMGDVSSLIFQPFIFPTTPITLANCFCLFGFFVFWYELLTTMPLVIALERFLSVFCPIWTKTHKFLHSTLMFGLGIGHSLWFLFGLVQSVLLNPSKYLTCMAATVYFENQSTPGSNQYFENGLIFAMVGAAILLYIFIWFLRPKKSASSNNAQAQMDKRFLRCICFIVLMMCVARLTPTIFAFITPLAGWGEDVHNTICSLIMKLPQASALLILYIYGSEYRKAIDKLLSKMGIKSNQVHSLQISRRFITSNGSSGNM